MDRVKLTYVNSFEYLGVTLSCTMKSFSAHIMKRCAKALSEVHATKNPTALSIETALKIFAIKVAPMILYGIDLIWEHMSVNDMERMDKVKAAYLKRCLGLNKSARNRLVFQLAGAPYLVEETQRTRRLPRTQAFEDYVGKQERKLAMVNPKFYGTVAMTTNEWKEHSRENRHLVTRSAVHGFHGALCVRDDYHEPDGSCFCVWCGRDCPLYHGAECQAGFSLAQLDDIYRARRD